MLSDFGLGEASIGLNASPKRSGFELLLRYRVDF